jgi:hypothetical protein
MIPDHLLEIIITDGIILTRNEKGWKKIHNQIRNNIHLKKTDFIFDFKTIQFETINRVDALYLSKRKYMWLKKFDHSNKYFYERPKMRFSVNDIFSTDEFGNFLDDEIDYENAYLQEYIN